jgi:hypothetical protein
MNIIILQPLSGDKIEEKLHLGVCEQQRLIIIDLRGTRHTGGSKPGCKDRPPLQGNGTDRVSQTFHVNDYQVDDTSILTLLKGLVFPW